MSPFCFSRLRSASPTRIISCSLLWKKTVGPTVVLSYFDGYRSFGRIDLISFLNFWICEFVNGCGSTHYWQNDSWVVQDWTELLLSQSSRLFKNPIQKYRSMTVTRSDVFGTQFDWPDWFYRRFPLLTRWNRPISKGRRIASFRAHSPRTYSWSSPIMHISCTWHKTLSCELHMHPKASKQVATTKSITKIDIS